MTLKTRYNQHNYPKQIMLYPLLKGIHNLGAVLFLGSLLAILIEAVMARRAQRSYTLKGNLWNRAALGGLLVALGAGAGLFFVGGYPLQLDWLGVGIVLSALVFLLWHPLLMSKSRVFEQRNLFAGSGLFALGLGIMYLMTRKPF